VAAEEVRRAVVSPRVAQPRREAGREGEALEVHDTAPEVGMDRLGVAGVQPGVGDRHDLAGAVQAETRRGRLQHPGAEDLPGDVVEGPVHPLLLQALEPR
jgi:hypothetical protein